MAEKMAKLRQPIPAVEWFDLDREAKNMYLPLAEAVEKAKQSGWQVEAVSVIPGTIGYQLKSPDGEYLQFAGSEESCWQKAYQRGILTHIDEE